MGVFLDFSSKTLRILKWEGCFSLLPPTLRGGSNSTPDSEERGGGGGLSGGLQDVLSGVLVRGPPQILHCLRIRHCPRSWQKAIKDQPRADRIPEQRLAASQEYRAASEQRKDVPSPDRGKDCGFLNSFCFRPRPGVAHPVPRGIQTPGGPGNEPYRGHSGDADPPGGLWVPLGVLAHARPTATIGEKAVRDQEGLEMKTPQILIGDIPKKWPQRRAHGKFSYISSWILGVELGRNLGGQLVHSPTICRNLTFIPPWTDGRFTFP